MIQDLLRSIDPKIIGHRLQEIRKVKGLTQQAIATLLGVSRTTVTAIEKGQRSLQPGEIVRLCEHWNIPVNDFVRQREVVGDFVLQLRAAAAHWETDWHISEATEEIQKLCENYLELENLCNSYLQRNEPPLYDSKGIPIEMAAEDIAIKERNRLGLGDAPILNLRELLESDVGLRIFYIKEMPQHVSGMFFLHEKLGGCIAINIQHPEERRRWSLAHEYAHFLVRRFQADVSFLYSHKRIPREERFADAFAEHFLMPTAGIRRRFYDLQRANQGKITPADFCTLAHLYYVSFEALVLRLEGLRLIPSSVWERLKDAGFKPRQAQALLGLEQRSPFDQPMPLRYQYLAAEAFERGDLSEGEFARFMGVDRLEARRLLESLGKTASIQEDGTVIDEFIDFASTVIDST